MSAFYVHKGYAPNNIMEWVVSVGTIAEPCTIHFKKESDLIAYLHGDWPHLTDAKIKERHKYIAANMGNDVREVVYPEWVGRWKLFFLKIKAKLTEALIRP